MSDTFQGRSTADLQAEFDSALKAEDDLRSKREPLQAELSKRHNARTFVFNQVIAGNAGALRENGVDDALIAEAEAYVATAKASNESLRSESAMEAAK